jgi:hypothetical protein
MAQKHHITRIYNTRSNLQANLDACQIAIETDNEENFIYKDDGGNYHIVANQSEDSTFLDVDCDTLTISTSNDLIITDLTSGSVLFAGTSSEISQDNDKFFWDNSNKYLGAGTKAPTSLIEAYANIASAQGLTITNANDDAAADVFLKFRTDATPTQKAILGIDSTNDSFRIETGTGALGATSAFVMSSAGNIGVNIAPGDTTKLYVSYTTTNTAGYGIISNVTKRLTENGSYTHRGLSFSAATNIGVWEDTGILTGVYGTALHNTLGNLANLRGFQIGYGSNSAAANVTTECIGLLLTPYCFAGSTFAKLADIDIQAKTGAGTITNEWCIYSAHNASSYFAGNMGLKQSPNAKWVLDVAAASSSAAIGNSASYLALRSVNTNYGYLFWDNNTANSSNAVAYLNVYVTDAATDTVSFSVTTSKSSPAFTIDGGRNLYLAGGNLRVDSDTYGLIVGAGQDAGISYNGTNMIYDSALVGTGNHIFQGTGGGGNIQIKSDTIGVLLGDNATGDVKMWYSGTHCYFDMLAGTGHFVFSAVTTVQDANVTIIGGEGKDAALYLNADEADDNGDKWRIRHEADDNILYWDNDTTGSFVAQMKLTTAGGLSVNADIGTGDDPVALFDDYNDPMEIKNIIQQRKYDRGVELGIYEKDKNNYMMKLQPMVRLLGGGIYQLYDKIKKLEEKILAMENKIAMEN